MPTASEIAWEIKNRLHKFRYVSDQVQFRTFENWRSHVQAIRDRVAWEGDCDDYACTAGTLLLLDYPDVDPAAVSLIACRVENGGGHLVCGISDEQVTHIIDNRHRDVMQADELPYKWDAVMFGNEPGIWRKAVLAAGKLEAV